MGKPVRRLPSGHMPGGLHAGRIAELAEEVHNSAVGMPASVRAARAEEIGLDPHVVFRRVDTPGRRVLSDARGRMYAAPTAWQAQQASQTGGKTVYPLILPKPIFGLHHNPKLKGITDEWLKGVTYEDWLDNSGDVIGAHLIGTPDSKFSAALLEGIEGINDRFRMNPKFEGNARESFLDANDDFLNWNRPVSGLTAWDFVEHEPEVPAAATNPLRQHMRNIGSGYNPQAMDHVADALQYQNVDGDAVFEIGDGPSVRRVHTGTGDLLKALGYAGTLVDDEAGISVVTFAPHKVRHATKSALDPAKKNRAGIYHSVLPLLPAAAGTASSQQGGVLEGLNRN